MLTAGGGALIIAGAVAFAAPITAVVVVGGAVLSAGICTGVKTYADPNCSLLEFVKVTIYNAARRLWLRVVNISDYIFFFSCSA